MKLLKTCFFSLIIITNLHANFLNEKIPNTKEISKINFEDLPTRNYEDIVLYGKSIKNIKFSISYPKKLNKNENIIILLNGLETGKNSLKYITHPSNYIIIGYEYPSELQRLKNKSILLHLFSTRKVALHVPMQIICIIEWIKKQKWYNHKNVSIIGTSFGAIFVPATYHLAQKNNIQLDPGILAFGIAGLYDIFYANLKNYHILRSPLAYFAYLTFKPLDPIYHLPYIHNNFLFINGIHDKNIPFKSAKKLQDLTPEPKTIINIDSQHISPDNKELINQIIDISLKWLNENK